ncbi:hypothetical protein GCM10009133_18710 [Cocleimonas flava]|uniref:Nuclear transport factor 2 family protein n=1 Tax=Cocleimonas flava TaxID=634765 RepID=A0A4V2P883_9GAMM|nr:hypothetical protein [Cocleimonas flava]TCJ84795.1 hypothetical protein EV695_2756 [Cocleimonas flava]
MTPNSAQAQTVKETLDSLIHAASSAHLEILETLYHNDMKIYMLAGSDQLHIMNKPDFIAHLKESMKDGNTPSTWANYHLVEADETYGHVIISRKVNLTGEEKIITLSIDFIFEDGRWQITREVIYT